jgi:FixJ family two-component response regulator
LSVDSGTAPEVRPEVVLIDDDRLLRRSVKRLLETNGYLATTYESLGQFLKSGRRPKFGCAILDLNLPDASGLEIQDKLAKSAPTVSIIFLSGYGKVGTSVRAMKAGALDFLEKPVDNDVLLTAVGAAIERSRQLLTDRSDREKLEQRLQRLTARERQVFALVTSGLLNKQAAAELGLTEKTIKVHRAHVTQKMEAASFAELTKMAQKLGLEAEPPQPSSLGRRQEKSQTRKH